MNDKELLAQLKEGSREAFSCLFERYRHMVYNVSYRMTGNRQEAEDITQDVFIKIFHAAGKFRGDAQLSSWIYRITVNSCLKSERRKKLENWISLEFLFQDQGARQPTSPDDAADKKMEISENERIVQQAVLQLPGRQRTAIVLQRYEQKSYAEIAQVMEISLPAVESLLHRAKDNLTKKLLPMKKHLR